MRCPWYANPILYTFSSAPAECRRGLNGVTLLRFKFLMINKREQKISEVEWYISWKSNISRSQSQVPTHVIFVGFFCSTVSVDGWVMSEWWCSTQLIRGHRNSFFLSFPFHFLLDFLLRRFSIHCEWVLSIFFDDVDVERTRSYVKWWMRICSLKVTNLGWR